MGRRKVKFTLPKLNDCGGNLNGKWYIEYSYRDERSGKLERFRTYQGFNLLPTTEEKRTHAQEIIKSISERLLAGWTPFDFEKVSYDNQIIYDIQSKAYGNRTDTGKNLLYFINLFLSDKKPFVGRKTWQDYTSKLRLLHHWLHIQGKEEIYAQEITNDLIKDYVLYMMQERKLEKRTINDSKQRISQLFNWMVKNQMLDKNPIYDLPQPKQKNDYSAQPMTKKEASFLLNYIKKNDKQLHLFCSMIFYCAIRPGTELRLLKIKDINLFTNTIKINCENAKTDGGMITIPDKLVKILEKMRFTSMNRDFYLFGKGGKPGVEPWGKNHFRVEFNKHRDAVGFPKEFKLYSWKCTGGILFLMSGAPLAAIRDHFRHKSTAYTDIYLSKKIGKQNDYVKHEFPEL